MATSISYPGVFVEETSFRARPIESVPTSTAGFVGAARFGPLGGLPSPVTSLTDYERRFCLTTPGRTLDWSNAGAAPDFLWHAVRAFFNEGGRRLFVSRVFRPAAGDGVARVPVAQTPGWSLAARYPGAAGNLRVRLELRSRSTVMVSVLSRDGAQALGVWDRVSVTPGHATRGQADSLFARFGATPGSADGEPAPILITADPAAITSTTRAMRALFGKGRLTPGRLAEFDLEGGNDGTRPGAAEIAGGIDPASGEVRGLVRFEAIDEIALVAAPGITWRHGEPRVAAEAEAAMAQLVAHAERLRYRVALLDSGEGQAVAEVRALRARFDSSFAALYYPWVSVADPVSGAPINLPPSGFIAGICARVDIERGVWKPPANEVLRSAIGFERDISAAQQEQLNPEGINCLRQFAGRGLRVWGARTLSRDPEWKYLNVRRYIAWLEHSIEAGTQWAVFEPNAEPLWSQVRRAVEDFLFNEWQRSALLGETPAKAYFVRCDRSTMTQADLDNGRLVCLIGVAMIAPAEFMIVRIGQWTADRVA